MTTVTIPIEGKLMKLKHEHVKIELLDFDQENPRIGLFIDGQLEEDISKKKIEFAIKAKNPEAYKKLKDAIHHNKGITNPVWLEPISDGKYKVIEGNTRVMIYQELAILEPNETQWKNIYAVKLPKGVNEEEKNFIRLLAHLRGTNEWDAYEKAKYLFKLSEEDWWPISKIEIQTKLKKRDIEQNIQAYKVMQTQYLPDHLDDPSEVSKFSYFVEYVKDDILQRAMEKRGLTIQNFCSWVGDKTKLPRGQDVRQLRDILEDEAATELFLREGYESAVGLLAYLKPDLINPFYKNIERIIDKLQDMSAYEIDEIATEGEEGGRERLINDLSKWSTIIVKMIDDKKDDE